MNAIVLFYLSELFRILTFLVFLPILYFSWRETRIKDRITRLRYSIFFFILIFFLINIAGMYLVGCRFYGCNDYGVGNILSVIVSFGQFVISAVLFLIYKTRYDE